MLFTNAVTLKFSDQFHVMRNTIFHTKHMKFLLNEISYKYVKFLPPKLAIIAYCMRKISKFLLCEISQEIRNRTLFCLVSYIAK